MPHHAGTHGDPWGQSGESGKRRKTWARALIVVSRERMDKAK